MNGKTLFAFVTGTVVGAAGAWVYFNKKYFGDTIPIEEEQVDLPSKIEHKSEEETSDDTATVDTDESDRVEYHKAINQYTEDKDENKGPYVISQDEFGDGTMITTVTYSYFEDGVLTDENNMIVEDADEALGEDFVNHFEEDLCYIRNEQRHCDYEILREGITYYEPPEEE